MGRAGRSSLTLPEQTEAPIDQSVHRHDGFYFRFALGPAMLFGGVDDRPNDIHADLSGIGLMGDLALGGTVLALGALRRALNPRPRYAPWEKPRYEEFEKKVLVVGGGCPGV